MGDLFKSSCFSGNGRMFMAIAHDGRLRIWDTQSQRPHPSNFENTQTQNKFTCCALNKDGTLAVVGNEIGQVLRLDLETAQFKKIGTHHGQVAVTAVVFHPLEEKAYTGGFDNNTIEWDVRNLRLLRRFKFARHSMPSCLAVSSDGNTLACARSHIKLWDLVSGQKLTKFSGHTNPIVSLKFVDSPSTSSLVLLSAAENDKFIACWTLPDAERSGGKLPQEILAPSGCFIAKGGAVSSLVLSQNHDMFVALNDAHDVLASWKGDVIQMFGSSGNSNGKFPTKPIKPHGVAASFDKKNLIHGACFKSPSELFIACGSGLKPRFATIKIVDDNDKPYDFRIEIDSASSGKKRSRESADGDRAEGEDADENKEGEHVSKKAKVGQDQENTIIGTLESVHGAMLKTKTVKLARTNDIDSENGDALSQIAAEHAAKVASSEGVGSSMSLTLEQGLQIGDKSSIESCLSTRDMEVIKQTVERLSQRNVMELLEYIVIELEGGPRRAYDLMPWLMTLVETHAMFFIKGSGNLSESAFKTLYQLTDARLASFSKFMELEGRIGVVLNHHRFQQQAKQRRHADMSLNESNIVNANAPLTVIQEN
eukprot:TRINITY_DN9074_c0_g1_i1.p1 TRINITY_DN9074_c0_g1~~TRINITY_DN9074_c0_g1_i1.p1  ORF type:complete len:595 (+),score=164.57 TRINITY_DN9074_c0_g1_i1:112-1896(+)